MNHEDFYCESQRAEYEQSQELWWAQQNHDPLWINEQSSRTLTKEENEMSIQELYPSTSNHLKAADLKGMAVKVIIASFDIAKFDNGSKLVLGFEGKDKTLVLNKTNANILSSFFGDDEQAWKGKEIMIYPDKTNFGGEIVDCLRVRIEAPTAEFDDDIPW